MSMTVTRIPYEDRKGKPRWTDGIITDLALLLVLVGLIFVLLIGCASAPSVAPTATPTPSVTAPPSPIHLRPAPTHTTTPAPMVRQPVTPTPKVVARPTQKLSKANITRGVAFYADSLGFLTDAWLRTRVGTVYSHAYPGSALCDWLPAMPGQLAAEHPKVVLVAFAGNNLSPCMRPGGRVLSGAELSARYARDARSAVALIRASGAQAVLVRAPVGDARWQALGMVGSREVINGWTLQPGAWTLDGGKYLAPQQCFVMTINGRQVRQPDGLHLTPLGAALYAKSMADGLQATGLS